MIFVSTIDLTKNTEFKDDVKIVPYPCQSNTHYAVFRRGELIAFCTYPSSAEAVRNDAIRKETAEHQHAPANGDMKC